MHSVTSLALHRPTTTSTSRATPRKLGSVAPYPREETSKEERRSGGFLDSFATHFCVVNDTLLAASGVGIAGSTRWVRAPSARPRAGLFSMATQGQNVVSGSLWLAFLSCSSPLTEAGFTQGQNVVPVLHLIRISNSKKSTN